MPVTRAVHRARVTVPGPEGDRRAVVRFRDDEGPVVAELARILGLPPDDGLDVDGRLIGPCTPLTEAGLADGSQVRGADRTQPGLPAWTLWVVGGLDTGRRWPVPGGPSLIGAGRAVDVVIDDLDDQDAATLHVHEDGSITVVDRDGVRRAAPGAPVRTAHRLVAVTRATWAPRPTPVGHHAPPPPDTGV